jgi:hypothetical protein
MVKMKVKMPKGATIKKKDFLDASEKTARDLGKRVHRAYGELTSDWRTDGARPIDVPVIFEERVSRSSDRVTVTVKTDSLKYRFVDLGTEPHPIEPRPENLTGLLKFPSEFTPRTTVKSLAKKDGGKNWGGTWTMTPHVEHPGIKEPRHFEVPIIKEQIPIVKKEWVINIKNVIKIDTESV